MMRFFELKPYLDEYRRMLSQRIRGASWRLQRLW
jgi:hypothetical protein